MLQCMITVSKLRNIPEIGWTADHRDRPDLDSATLRPLNARSLALSALLGTHPPRLPTRALVALADLFEIPGGTMRTALSRMVAKGEVVHDQAQYRLAGRMLELQRAQDAGRRAPRVDWDGRWHTIVVTADHRRATERRQFRSLMANHRFGELRPDIWIRPDNLGAPPTGTGWICTSGRVSGIEPQRLAERIWELDSLATTAHRSLRRLDEIETVTDWADHRSIPQIFTIAATVLRFLRSDPLLPSELAPEDWPFDRLRLRYDSFEHAHQLQLRAFLRSA
jgi:phenylacetic acid degradation operon negative regulatory protein